jgi:hypothetical protein
MVSFSKLEFSWGGILQDGKRTSNFLGGHSTDAKTPHGLWREATQGKIEFSSISSRLGVTILLDDFHDGGFEGQYRLEF